RSGATSSVWIGIFLAVFPKISPMHLLMLAANRLKVSRRKSVGDLGFCGDSTAGPPDSPPGSPAPLPPPGHGPCQPKAQSTTPTPTSDLVWQLNAAHSNWSNPVGSIRPTGSFCTYA